MPDISKEELEHLYDEIDAEIKKNGLPTEEELRAEIEELNKTAPDEHTTDRPRHDAPSLAPSARNRVIIAIGDLHGHKPALDRLLSGLQSKYGIFRKRDPDRLRRGVTIVFTGDYIDRGKSALAIIEKLRRLGSTNPGHVFTLLGNHELLALEAYDDAKKLATLDNEKDALQKYRNRTCHGMNGGDCFIREFGQRTVPALKSYVVRMARNGDVGRWIRALLPCYETRIAKKRILFMHADLSSRFRDRKVFDHYLREVENRRGAFTPDAGGSAAKYGHQLFKSSGSIFWCRSFHRLEDADPVSIDNICDSAEVDFLVTGHTPHDSIKVYGNRIFDIDVGMTPGCCGNIPQALLFRSDGIVGFRADGTETTFVRWK